MRRLQLLLSSPLLSLALAAPLAGQDVPPSNWAALELERSATCVDALTRLEALDVELAPLAARAQRLLAIAGAIAVEESAIVDSLNVGDPLEASVRDWFAADAALAQRYLSEQSQAILDERAAGREQIQQSVAEALEGIQAEADSVVAPTGTLRDDATACSGAILVRSAAAAACSGLTSRVCEAARDSTVQSPFPFIESPDLLWYQEELRPWTAPAPLQVSPQGQLAGARTVGSTRVGNILISVSLNPLFRPRDELTPDELAVIDSINTPLGIESTHPNVTFVPALAVQATLPSALGDEDRYVVHFGPLEEPDVVWMANANTGRPLAGTVALAPEHVARLLEGHPITLTAIKDSEVAEEPDAVFAVELSSLNQVSRVRALLAYMGQQLSADLERLIPPQSPPEADPATR